MKVFNGLTPKSIQMSSRSPPERFAEPILLPMPCPVRPVRSPAGPVARRVGTGLGVIVMSSALACAPPADPGDAVWVVIPVDAPVEVVAESLEVNGIVRSAERFARLARFGRRHLGIKPGTYPLRPGTSQGQVLATLRRGTPPVSRVVIRERMTLREAADQLAAALGMAEEDVLAAARDSALRARVGARGETIEGYLYPVEYYMRRDATPLDVLRQMSDTFVARWAPAWDARLDTLDLTRDDVVTLASIIAGEMPLGAERFRVASVYHNRLARGMRLQADPTVVYALGERRRLTFDDYRIASDYNTYAIRALPPGPIGQPSTASLEAALYPEATDFLYLVARADGSHAFSRSYWEHLRTIRQLRGAPRVTRQGPPAKGRATRS